MLIMVVVELDITVNKRDHKLFIQIIINKSLKIISTIIVMVRNHSALVS